MGKGRVRKSLMETYAMELYDMMNTIDVALWNYKNRVSEMRQSCREWWGKDEGYSPMFDEYADKSNRFFDEVYPKVVEHCNYTEDYFNDNYLNKSVPSYHVCDNCGYIIDDNLPGSYEEGMECPNCKGSKFHHEGFYASTRKFGKMKKFFEFNDSRLDAFKYAFESEWSMLCMRNDGITHEETQLDDRNFAAIVASPQIPMPQFYIDAFIHSIERMGFKFDFYTDRPYENGLIYEFYAIDNQTHGYESLLDEPVEVVDGRGNEYTLRQAIEAFGISSEPENPDDARVFARCPRLKGLIGPMAPNHGYVARYESQEVYDMLSRSTRKMHVSSDKAHCNDCGWNGTYESLVDDDDQFLKCPECYGIDIDYPDARKSFKSVYDKQRNKYGKVMY